MQKNERILISQLGINIQGQQSLLNCLSQSLLSPINHNRRGCDSDLGACPSNGRDRDGSEMSRMRDGGSSRLLIMSLRDPTTKQTGHFRPTRRAACFLAPLCGRGSSEYHPRQVRHRRRFLMTAKNHAVATRRLLGQAPRSQEMAQPCRMIPQDITRDIYTQVTRPYPRSTIGCMAQSRRLTRGHEVSSNKEHWIPLEEFLVQDGSVNKKSSIQRVSGPTYRATYRMEKLRKDLRGSPAVHAATLLIMADRTSVPKYGLRG